MSTKALLEKFNTPSFYKENIIKFSKNDTIDYSKISEKLINLGYKRTTNVTDIGEFALRGDILDIYGLDENPVRIEFFADSIEDIRFFNPTLKKAFNQLIQLKFYPCTNLF